MTLQIRPAAPDDRHAVIQMTREVWGGTDYLPAVWEQWIADPDGYLMVAVDGKQVLGLQRVRRMQDNTAWLEGIRVAPEARGQGVAGALLHEGLQAARAYGCTAARLTTANHNEASNRLAQSGGFTVLRRYALFRCSPDSGLPEQPEVRPATFGDLDSLAGALDMRNHTPLFVRGWTAYPLTHRELNLLVAQAAVTLCPGDGVMISTCQPPYRTLRVGHLEGNADAVRSLLGWLRRESVDLGITQLRLALPEGSLAARLLPDYGIEPAYDFAMLLYERSLTP